jgi:hypothetical protein
MSILAVLLAAASAQASGRMGRDPANVIGALGPFRPQPGAWVEYLVQSRGEQDVRVRLAIVSPPPDRARAWVEVATIGARSIPFAARLLLNTATGELERASVYALGQAPFDLPVGGDDPARVPPPTARVVPGRAKTVTVPAGTFSATELRVSAGVEVTRVWRTDEVPLWGIVRARQRARTIELLRFGRTGARSVFPGLHGMGSDSTNE